MQGKSSACNVPKAKTLQSAKIREWDSHTACRRICSSWCQQCACKDMATAAADERTCARCPHCARALASELPWLQLPVAGGCSKSHWATCLHSCSTAPWSSRKSAACAAISCSKNCRLHARWIILSSGVPVLVVEHNPRWLVVEQNPRWRHTVQTKCDTADMNSYQQRHS